jgi:DNA-binding NarL/FixJ family response regulator
MESRAGCNRDGSARPTLEPLERRVLELIAEGLSDREVAAQLGVPVDSVRAQLTAIIEKLGASSKLEALLVAIRHGLIRLPPP